MSSMQSSSAKQIIFSLHICDTEILQRINMPNIKNGGLFVPAELEVAIGDQVFLIISLIETTNKVALRATVIWITPKQTQENKTPGFGVRFNSPKQQWGNKLDALLKDEKAFTGSSLTL